MKTNSWVIVALFFMVLCARVPASSADLQWSGTYRVEGNYIKNFTLCSSKCNPVEDSYLTNHLVLSPKIIAADGLNIKSRFDIFNNGLNNNQIGAVMGNYTGSSSSGQASPPAVLTKSQQPETIVVNELYLNWVNEFGALVAGRVPFNFGLGMTYNSGQGMFDHFLSTKDMVGYKLVLGNISIMPAYGKVREGYLLNEDDINDFLVVAEYTNPETDLSMGFMFSNRVAPQDANAPSQGDDFPTSYFSNSSANFGAAQLDPSGSGFNVYNMNFYVKKKTENFNIGAELGFINGYTGLQVLNNTKNGAFDRVQYAGFGAAGEVGYRTGNLTLNLRGGLASGDDPDTSNIESYYFSPNYDVAMIMFNYPVGSPGYDALRSGLAGTRPWNSNPSMNALNGLDTEVITNAIYFAPNINLALGERYDLFTTIAYATQLKSPSSTNLNQGGTGSTIGLETDFGLKYHPSDKFMWATTFGLFFPGSAYAGPGGQFATDMAYGATSKAGISF